MKDFTAGSNTLSRMRNKLRLRPSLNNFLNESDGSFQKEAPNSLLSTKNQICKSRSSLLSQDNSKKAQMAIASATKQNGDFQIIEEEELDTVKYTSNVSLPFTIKNPYLKALAEDESILEERLNSKVAAAQLNADHRYKSPLPQKQASVA